MHVLVLSANGLLGSNVVTAARDRGWTVTGTYHSAAPTLDVPLVQLDITDTTAVHDVVADTDPDWIVNCAAMTDVDGCEEDPERAHAVNARAPGELAQVCAEESIRFLHVSTDYVFDGTETGGYAEDATTNPILVYGESKLRGECEVRECLPDALLTRLSFVYGLHRGTGELTGFPAWVRSRLDAGERTPLFTDQHVTPTRAGHAAQTFCELLDATVAGTYHVAARSCVTPYEFGSKIAQRLDANDALLAEGSQADVDRQAARPANTCLDVTRIEETLGREQPTLDTDLDAITEAFEPTIAD